MSRLRAGSPHANPPRRSEHGPRRHLAVLAAAFTLTLGCEGGGHAAGASGATSRADGRSAWVRVTPAGLRALPEALRVSLGRQGSRTAFGRERQGDLTLCTGGRCSIELVPERLSLTPRTSGELGVSARVRAVARGIGVRYEQTWACAFSGRPACEVSLDTASQPPRALTVTALLAARVDGRTGLTTFSLGGTNVRAGLDPGDVRIGGTNLCGRIWCTVANAVGARRWLADEANRAVVAAVTREAAARTCLPCEARCPSGTRCEEGLCRGRDGTCAPRPLAVTATLPAPDGRQGAALSLALADEVGLRRGGLDLALRLAARPDGRHRCAPPADPVPHTPLSRDVLRPEDDGRAHVRVAVAESAVARAVWALHQAGVGCMDVDGSQVPQLDAAMLAMVLPSSARLAPLGLDAPSIALRPLAPPSVRVRDDGSVALELSAARMDVEGVVDGRRLRLASATLRVRAAAQVGADGPFLAIRVPPEGVAVEVVDVWSSPILAAGRRELRNTFEVLSAAAVGVIPESLALDHLALPGQLVPLAARGIDDGSARALVIDLALQRDGR